ncbi:MAG: ABC-F type ribosomal protection protein [Defluviitaleaceae bacterium]|nr:ABC-F type ribosomal protection protein [Defluviitaleaceae bacterium]
MSLIDVVNLTFSYDGSSDEIFSDVSFRIETDWKLGFCGRNGRGKTTFLMLLAGRYEYRGTINAGVNFEYFPFEITETWQSVAKIMEAIAPKAELWQVQKELNKLAVDESVFDRQFETLSNGERTKVMLAGLFLRENAFLLIDEPTNHLDMAARDAVARYLRDKPGFILVSHDRAFLDACVDHVLSINRADIEVQSGNFSSWFHNKKLRDGFELAENEKLKKEIKRLEDSAKRSADWADKVEKTKMGKGAEKARKKGHAGMDMMAYYGEKSRRLQQRRKNLERRQQSAVEEKSGLLKNLEKTDSLQIHQMKYHSNALLSFSNVSISYGGRKILSRINFSLEHGDRLAVMGSNGSGKSSILKLLRGEKIDHEGEVRVGSGLIISYVPQDASFLTGDLRKFSEEKDIDETLFKAILRKLDFKREQFEKDMGEFSAGQKKKALIAASLCQKAHVYIWDEPLNYVDILSRIQIEELIAAYKPTMVFVEHDRAFCTNAATKSIELKNNECF